MDEDTKTKLSITEMLSSISDELDKIPEKCKNTPLEDICNKYYSTIKWITSEIHRDAYSCKIDSLIFDTIRFAEEETRLILDLKSRGLRDLADSIRSEILKPAEHHLINDIVRILENRCNLKPPTK
jgi:spore coat polysaccharide biosynthesis predicted glycosyltransferase SpsG